MAQPSPTYEPLTINRVQIQTLPPSNPFHTQLPSLCVFVGEPPRFFSRLSVVRVVMGFLYCQSILPSHAGSPAHHPMVKTLHAHYLIFCRLVCAHLCGVPAYDVSLRFYLYRLPISALCVYLQHVKNRLWPGFPTQPSHPLP